MRKLFTSAAILLVAASVFAQVRSLNSGSKADSNVFTGTIGGDTYISILYGITNRSSDALFFTNSVFAEGDALFVSFILPDDNAIAFKPWPGSSDMTNITYLLGGNYAYKGVTRAKFLFTRTPSSEYYNVEGNGLLKAGNIIGSPYVVTNSTSSRVSLFPYPARITYHYLSTSTDVGEVGVNSTLTETTENIHMFTSLTTNCVMDWGSVSTMLSGGSKTYTITNGVWTRFDVMHSGIDKTFVRHIGTYY